MGGERRGRGRRNNKEVEGEGGRDEEEEEEEEEEECEEENEEEEEECALAERIYDEHIIRVRKRQRRTEEKRPPLEEKEAMMKGCENSKGR